MIIDGIESSTRWQHKTLPKTWGDRFNTSIADVSLPQALPMLSHSDSSTKLIILEVIYVCVVKM